MNTDDILKVLMDYEKYLMEKSEDINFLYEKSSIAGIDLPENIPRDKVFQLMHMSAASGIRNARKKLNLGGDNAALEVGIKEENEMLNGVTIIAGDEVRIGNAQIMHNDMGEEILMIKTEKRRALYPACKQTAEEAAPKQTKIVKRISKPKAIKKSEVAEELTPKTPMLQVKSKNRRAGRPVICLDNNIKFNSMIEAAKTLFPDKNGAPNAISCCCRGVRETAYGLRFKYAD